MSQRLWNVSYNLMMQVEKLSVSVLDEHIETSEMMYDVTLERVTWQHRVMISDVFRIYVIGCFPAWSWFLGEKTYVTRAEKTGSRYIVLLHIKDIALEFGWMTALLRPSVIASISSNSFCPATVSRNISITTVISIMALFATLQCRWETGWKSGQKEAYFETSDFVRVSSLRHLKLTRRTSS